MTVGRWGRMAARALAAAVLVGGAVPLMAGTAWACSCIGYSSEEEQYRDRARASAVIYTALVTEEQRPAQPNNFPVRYTMQVEDTLKGEATGNREVTTSDNEASCGLDLEPGRRALVLEFDGSRTINLCDGTTQERVDPRADIVRDELSRPQPPPPAPRPSAPPNPVADPPSLPRTGAETVAVVAGLTLVSAAAAVAGASGALRRKAS
ncbi:MAG TPA: hypothetical protein VNB94_02495 [Mycobacteriales bacterium]|nr:hypothetical protein [Mycobacteriales bacterium]